MREFAFTVRFSDGADELMDLFSSEPALSARSRACFANQRAMWRIDELHGPAEPLGAAAERYVDESACNECLDVSHCDSTREYTVLDSGPEYRVIYTRREDIAGCHSIPSLAVDEIGDGVLFEARRREDAYVWRLLVPGDTAVGRLYDRIRDGLREGLALEMGHVTDAADSSFVGSERVLSTDERRVLTAAVDAGYYGTPRETTVAELAEALDEPRSTVQHRLQRAEAAVVEQFLRER